MAISDTRSFKKTAPLRQRVFVLYALYVGFQASPSSSSSIFALAAEAKYEGSTRGSSNGVLLQRTPGEEYIGEEVEHEFFEEEELQYEGNTRGFTNRMLLQRTQAEAEDADDGVEDVIVAKAAATCTDKQTIKIKPRKSPRVFVCDYVKEKPEARCKKTIKRVIKRKGKVVRTTRINPKQHCCETCEPYTTAQTEKPTAPPVTDPAQSSCPHPIPSDDNGGQLCFSDREDLGFFRGQTCDYQWVGTGCTEADYQCQPSRTCTCGKVFGEPGYPGNTWTCEHQDLKGVNLWIPCPREPEPYEKSGEQCDPNVSPVGIRQ